MRVHDCAGHGDPLCRRDGELRITHPIENAIFDLTYVHERSRAHASMPALTKLTREFQLRLQFQFELRAVETARSTCIGA